MYGRRRSGTVLPHSFVEFERDYLINVLEYAQITKHNAKGYTLIHECLEGVTNNYFYSLAQRARRTIEVRNKFYANENNVFERRRRLVSV